MEEQKPDLEPQSYWRIQRSDFFPEPSFQNWSSYRSALSQTPLRLRNRFLGRSSDAVELGAVRRRSEHDMKRCLNWWDLTWFGFGSVIGAGIFVLTGQEAHNHAGPAIVLSYIAAGISAMLSVFCYTEFAVEIPVAGGSFAYIRVELGDFAAFIAAGNIILQAILGKAAVARAWTSYLATLINKPPNSLRIRADNLAENYNLLDPIAVVVLMVTGTLAVLSTKKASWFNSVSSVVHVAVMVFIIVAGFVHSDTENLTPFMPYGAKGVFQAAAIVYFAYGGFDSIATMAEETKNPAKDIPLGLLGSMSVITVIYCLMALALSMMQRYMGKPKEGGISANWESSHTILFCDLCIREIELGNRPTTHFSKDGWKNLVTKFKDGSGLLYDRAQLKNKWDQLKREWKLWKDLKKGETGLGWYPIKKTIDASDLWWQERIKMIPLAKKFRYAGIAPELEERLDSMFRQVVATGRNVWFPAAGIMPPLFADEEVVLVDEDNSTELGDDIASPPEKVPLPKKLGKRKKVEKGRKNDILARMDDLVESSRSVSSRITTPIVPPSLLLLDEAVDEIEKNEEICADPDFYDFATVFLLTTVNRGMFLKLPAHKRVIWLKNRYNQSTGRVG